MIKTLYIFCGRCVYFVLYPFFKMFLSTQDRARVVVRVDGRVLLVKSWLGSGRWELPGGGLHNKEDPKLGVCREVFEETGIKLKANQFKSLGTYKNSFVFKNKYFFYETTINEEPKLRLQPIEISDAGFFKKEEISELNIDPLHRKYI